MVGEVSNLDKLSQYSDEVIPETKADGEYILNPDHPLQTSDNSHIDNLMQQGSQNKHKSTINI